MQQKMDGTKRMDQTKSFISSIPLNPGCLVYDSVIGITWEGLRPTPVPDTSDLKPETQTRNSEFKFRNPQPELGNSELKLENPKLKPETRNRTLNPKPRP